MLLCCLLSSIAAVQLLVKPQVVQAALVHLVQVVIQVWALKRNQNRSLWVLLVWKKHLVKKICKFVMYISPCKPCYKIHTEFIIFSLNRGKGLHKESPPRKSSASKKVSPPRKPSRRKSLSPVRKPGLSPPSKLKTASSNFFLILSKFK